MAGSRFCFSCTPAFGIRAFALCLILTFCAPSERAAAFDSQPSAEHFFRLLPVDIFENTGEPFAETDKDLLFAKGYTPVWMLAHNSADTLIVAALDAIRTEVILHLFRGNASAGVLVLNARTPSACACEFWSWDAKGGLVPQPAPEDPVIADFFPAGRPLPADLQAEYFYCLTGSAYDELEAQPRFWDSHGLVNITPTVQVRYTWNGTTFVKKIMPER